MRVQRLKQLLLFGPYILVLISLLLCVILFVLLGRETAKVDELENEVKIMADSQSKVEGKVDKIDSSVTALDDKSGQIEALLEKMASEKEEAGQTENVRQERPYKVYLTFDDGPSPNTEKILDILKEYNVKANFFVVGTESTQLRKMYRRILDEGHVLGMHSYSHKYSDIYSSTEAFTKDLDKITQLLYDETGVCPTLYRFPAGSVNDVSRVDMKELIPILEARGITYYDWNVASGDATNPMLPTDKIIENALSSIGEYDEAMILFHDLGNKTTTVEALPSIIEALLANDIPIALIDEDTMSIRHNNKQ